MITTNTNFSQTGVKISGRTNKKPGSNTLKPNPNHISINPHSLQLKNPSFSLEPSLMAINLTRPKHRSLTNPSLIHLFSTTTPKDPSPQNPTNQQQQQQPHSQSSQTSSSSFFSDVKASLKQKQQQQQQNNPNLSPLKKPIYPSMTYNSSNSSSISKVSSLEEIRKNLSEFRRRSAVPNPTETNPPLSFQDLYKRNVIAKSNESDSNTQSAPVKSGVGGGGGGKLSFEAIRESLSQMKAKKGGNAGSFEGFKNTLRLKPENAGSNVGPMIIGGTDELPQNVFGREMKGEGGKKSEAMRTEFLTPHSYEDLGKKLRELRPDGVKEREGWSLLEELNERLGKLREIEQSQNQLRIGGVSFNDLRESLVTMKLSDDEKSKKTSIQRLDILNHLGGTPDYMLQPPKEHLVEKYFHPDNMSSGEKLKIELSKVRDEFKMSESDCGSARVQVAQLTTKIKHLSSALHKKDKHSRKGLQAMVQRRKKLLKYLRRTDWDSYCLVLSKLGLRDNPDYKN